MTKAAPINFCCLCTFYKKELFFKLTKNFFGESKYPFFGKKLNSIAIPDWCPLDDYKQPHEPR